MSKPIGPLYARVSYTQEHTPTTPRSQPRRTRRPRTARPYLAVQPEAETLVLPAVTDDTAPPAPRAEEERVVGPWLQRHEQAAPAPAPAEDMADLRAAVRRLIADRPDPAHPVATGAGVHR